MFHEIFLRVDGLKMDEISIRGSNVYQRNKKFEIDKQKKRARISIHKKRRIKKQCIANCCSAHTDAPYCSSMAKVGFERVRILRDIKLEQLYFTSHANGFFNKIIVQRTMPGYDFHQNS
jgi:hypothetical protein